VTSPAGAVTASLMLEDRDSSQEGSKGARCRCTRAAQPTPPRPGRPAAAARRRRASAAAADEGSIFRRTIYLLLQAFPGA
jgi:hypothetical protein